MKFYEIRVSDQNKKYWYDARECLIYDGNFDLTSQMVHEEEGLYKVEFRDISDSITIDKLLANGFKLSDMNNRLDWVINDSDHRRDVRVVSEETFNSIKDNKTSYNFVYNINHLWSKHPVSFQMTRVMATEAFHNMGNISRKASSVAIVSESDDDNFYGHWADGYGFIDVRFPKKTTKIIDN